MKKMCEINPLLYGQYDDILVRELIVFPRWGNGIEPMIETPPLGSVPLYLFRRIWQQKGNASLIRSLVRSSKMYSYMSG